jgi:predicted ATP-dependent serine protease
MRKIAPSQRDDRTRSGTVLAILTRYCKPKSITDDIFLAQILGHKLLGPNASLSVVSAGRHRDKALLATMAYTFARIPAVVNLRPRITFRPENDR